jgi:CheY-like chemotaxis protein
MSAGEDNPSRQSALSRILQVVATKSSQGIVYTTAILGIAALFPDLQLPGVLNSIAGGLGVEALGSILDRVAHNDKLSDTEIHRQVERALAESGFEQLLTKDDFYHAYARLRKGQRGIKSLDEESIRILHRIETTITQLFALLESPGAVNSLISAASEDEIPTDVDDQVQRTDSKPLINCRALVIEDVASQQRAVKQILDELGARCLLASNLDDALEHIMTERLDLVILDMQLEPMDEHGQAGLLLLDQLNAYQATTPVIVISGLDWTTTNVRDFFVKYKTVDFFAKPFNPVDLRRRIEVVVGPRKGKANGESTTE